MNSVLENLQNIFLKNKYDFEVLADALNKLRDFYFGLPESITHHIYGELPFDFSRIEYAYGDEFDHGSWQTADGKYVENVPNLDKVLDALSLMITLSDVGLSLILDEEVLESTLVLFDSIGSNYQELINDKSVITGFFCNLFLFSFNNKKFAFANSIYEKNRQFIPSNKMLECIDKFFLKDTYHVTNEPDLAGYYYDGCFESNPLLSLADIDGYNQDLPLLLLKLIDNTYNYGSIPAAITSFLDDYHHFFHDEVASSIKDLFSKTIKTIKNFYENNKAIIDDEDELSNFILKLIDERVKFVDTVTNHEEFTFAKPYSIELYSEKIVDDVYRKQENINNIEMSINDFIKYFGVYALDNSTFSGDLIENFNYVSEDLEWAIEIKTPLIDYLEAISLFLYNSNVEPGTISPKKYEIHDESGEFSIVDWSLLTEDEKILYRGFDYESFITKYVFKSDVYPLFKDILDNRKQIESIFTNPSFEKLINKNKTIKQDILLKNDLSKYALIKELAYDFLDKTKEKDVKKLYQEKDLPEEEKVRIITSFLQSAKGYNNYPDVDVSDEKVLSLYDKIKANKIIVNQIISGELICSPFLAMENVANTMEGDYVFLVVCQIKTIERYLKEVLVQNYPNNIRIRRKEDGKLTPPVRFRDMNNLSADSLSSREYIGQGQYYGESWELGSVSLAVQLALTRENPYYSGIFKPRNPLPEQYMTFDFNKGFIQRVRNGYLHNDILDTLGKVLDIRKKIAYWLYRCIDELPSLHK